MQTPPHFLIITSGGCVVAVYADPKLPPAVKPHVAVVDCDDLRESGLTDLGVNRELATATQGLALIY